MLIATWNVNSILARLPHVMRWLDSIQPDVICMQETKCTDDKFPRLLFQERGYQCQLLGQASYNGVAILTRETCDTRYRGYPDDDETAQSRLITTKLSQRNAKHNREERQRRSRPTAAAGKADVGVRGEAFPYLQHRAPTCSERFFELRVVLIEGVLKVDAGADFERFIRPRIPRRLPVLKPRPAALIQHVDHLDLARRNGCARPTAAAQLGFGVSGRVAENVNLFAAADYSLAVGDGEDHSLGGRVGLRMTW